MWCYVECYFWLTSARVYTYVWVRWVVCVCVCESGFVCMKCNWNWFMIGCPSLVSRLTRSVYCFMWTLYLHWPMQFCLTASHYNYLFDFNQILDTNYQIIGKYWQTLFYYSGCVANKPCKIIIKNSYQLFWRYKYLSLSSPFFVHYRT